MNTKEQAEREYRAQWIRDAARDFITAHKAGNCTSSFSTGEALKLACNLWDRYVEERDKRGLPGTDDLISTEISAGYTVRFRKHPNGTISVARAKEGESPEGRGHGTTLAEAVADALTNRS